MSTSKTPGIKPAPIPWILCGPAYENLDVMSLEQAVSTKQSIFWCKLVLKVFSLTSSKRGEKMSTITPKTSTRE
jgi:hypothetical protein